MKEIRIIVVYRDNLDVTRVHSEKRWKNYDLNQRNIQVIYDMLNDIESPAFVINDIISITVQEDN